MAAAGVGEDRRVLSKSAQYRRLLKMYGQQQGQEQPLAAGTGEGEEEAQAGGVGGAAANDSCEMCQFVVQYLKIALANNETMAQVWLAGWRAARWLPRSPDSALLPAPCVDEGRALPGDQPDRYLGVWSGSTRCATLRHAVTLQIMHNLDRACETFSFGSGGESGERRLAAGRPAPPNRDPKGWPRLAQPGMDGREGCLLH